MLFSSLRPTKTFSDPVPQNSVFALKTTILSNCNRFMIWYPSIIAANALMIAGNQCFLEFFAWEHRLWDSAPQKWYFPSKSCISSQNSRFCDFYIVMASKAFKIAANRCFLEFFRLGTSCFGISTSKIVFTLWNLHLLVNVVSFFVIFALSWHQKAHQRMPEIDFSWTFLDLKYWFSDSAPQN